MPTSLVYVFFHAVWSTKFREPTLVREKRDILFRHMRQNAYSKEIYIDTIGGYTDHVHCLIKLHKEQTVAKVLQMIKGESAYWANKERLILPSLRWQEEYFAGSVDYNSVQVVRDYIINQEAHHNKKTFDDEYQEFFYACNRSMPPTT
jgi:putative transposase